MASKKIDTRAIGLDTALALSRWLTGKEHLHYGLWTGLDIAAGNVGAAQDAYSARLFALLPDRPGLRILDVGGGAGETAKKLIALGHKVEIVVPSAYLAARCRVNAPQASVHECTFEDLKSVGGFDLCLFSESFQYIPLPLSLQKARSLLAPGGEIVIGDCFRSDGFQPDPVKHKVGGGHAIGRFRACLASESLRVVSEEDITAAVAPSIDLEQALFNVLGVGLTGIEKQMKERRPGQHWLMHRLLNLVMNQRKRSRMAERLFERERNAETFVANNRYLLVRLAQD